MVPHLCGEGAGVLLCASRKVFLELFLWFFVSFLLVAIK